MKVSEGPHSLIPPSHLPASSGPRCPLASAASLQPLLHLDRCFPVFSRHLPPCVYLCVQISLLLVSVFLYTGFPKINLILCKLFPIKNDLKITFIQSFSHSVCLSVSGALWQAGSAAATVLRKTDLVAAFQLSVPGTACMPRAVYIPLKKPKVTATGGFASDRIKRTSTVTWGSRVCRVDFYISILDHGTQGIQGPGSSQLSDVGCCYGDGEGCVPPGT